MLLNKHYVDLVMKELIQHSFSHSKAKCQSCLSQVVFHSSQYYLLTNALLGLDCASLWMHRHTFVSFLSLSGGVINTDQAPKYRTATEDSLQQLHTLATPSFQYQWNNAYVSTVICQQFQHFLILDFIPSQFKKQKKKCKHSPSPKNSLQFYREEYEYKDGIFSPQQLFFLSVYQIVYANIFQLMVYLWIVQFHSPKRYGIGYPSHVLVIYLFTYLFMTG